MTVCHLPARSLHLSFEGVTYYYPSTLTTRPTLIMIHYAHTMLDQMMMIIMMRSMIVIFCAIIMIP